MTERTERAGRPWTTVELAAAAGVDGSYLRHMLLDGRLDGYKLGRDWLIPDDVARTWLAQREARWKIWDKRAKQTEKQTE